MRVEQRKLRCREGVQYIRAALELHDEGPYRNYLAVLLVPGDSGVAETPRPAEITRACGQREQTVQRDGMDGAGISSAALLVKPLNVCSIADRVGATNLGMDGRDWPADGARCHPYDQDIKWFTGMRVLTKDRFKRIESSFR